LISSGSTSCFADQRGETQHLARFELVGHRITGDRRLGRSSGAGYEKAHVAIDDATRLAYAEVLSDEKQATTVGFLIRAVAWSPSASKVDASPFRSPRGLDGAEQCVATARSSRLM